MMPRRGRVALLQRAADGDDIGTRERAALIRYGAPGHDPEHVLQELRRYVDLMHAYQRTAARAILDGLAEPPPDHPEGAA